MREVSEVYKLWIKQSSRLYGLAVERGQGDPHEAYNISAFLDTMKMVYGDDPMKGVPGLYQRYGMGIYNTIRIDVAHSFGQTEAGRRGVEDGASMDWFKMGKLNPKMTQDMSWDEFFSQQDDKG